MNNSSVKLTDLVIKIKNGIRYIGVATIIVVLSNSGLCGEKKESVSLKDNLYKNTKIAFESFRDGNTEICVMGADGTEQTNLTQNPAHDEKPCWSPDGSKIAFISDRGGNREIYIMNSDGSGQKQLTNNSSRINTPSWSPDGKNIVFSSVQGDDTRPLNWDIYVINVDGSEQRQLTHKSDRDVHPSWSPDGKKITFHSSSRKNAMDVYVMNADGSDKQNVTNSPVWDGYPSWSPNGEKIVYVLIWNNLILNNQIWNNQMNYRRDIFVMNQDGSDKMNLTNRANSDFVGSPIWSPDGKKIAFESFTEEKNQDIYVMNADGTDIKNLTNNTVFDGYHSWSPDGRKIVFMSKRDAKYSQGYVNSEIYVVNIDGSGQKRLTNNTAQDDHPSWSPFLPLESEKKQK